MTTQFAVKRFPFGTIDSIPAQSIPDGAASSSLNWLTKDGSVELRRGYALLGLTRQTGSGRITGLITGRKMDDTEIPIRARGRKLEYYNSATDDWVEIGTNILGTTIDATNGEDVSLSVYKNLAGAQIWASSPNTGLFKIMVSHPADAEDNFSATKNHKGYIKIKQGRMFLWNRGAQSASSLGGRAVDKQSLYGSYIDKNELSDYTQVTAENIGTGNGTTKTFAATLAQITGIRTAHNIVATDGTETFTDDLNGVLTGSAGGTGTINYHTGAISVTFNTAPANLQAITCDYYWEDSTANGIADFTKSTPRTAGQGFVMPQPDDGELMNVFAINNVEYCIHRSKAWALTLTATDTSATNLVFREKVGMPNFLAGVETGDGIYYIDDIDENDPHFRILTFAPNSTEVMPRSISKAFTIGTSKVGINLSDYRFDKSTVVEWGDYILFACRHKSKASPNNDTIFAYHKKQGSIDRLDYWSSMFAIYNGTLIAGDSASNNVFTLFSGVDDDGARIANYWIGNISKHGVARMKRTHKFVLEGEIGPNQIIQVYLSLDRGAFVRIGSVRGDGAYVDRTQAVNVGSATLGRTEMAGGGAGISAYHFKRMFSIHTSKYEEAQIKLVASEADPDKPAEEPIGWASVNLINFLDIRQKELKVINRYR